MAERIIDVSLTKESVPGADPEKLEERVKGVIAEKNPTGANPGETVIWSFKPTVGEAGKDLQVMFREVELADGSGTELCGPSGPFSDLSRMAERIVGTISSTARKGLYLYDIFLDSKKLEWENLLPPGRNFGGLEVPPPPPRG